MSFQGMCSQRFAGKPLRQPNYTFRDTPKATRTLSSSSIYEITNRDHFNDAMAEMVLLCNEVMRRKKVVLKQKTKGSKPLSLEYMADRLDVDDPLFGFMVRTDTIPQDYPSNQQDRFEKGMLQGFITVTTFTNWQKSFRWDSVHDSAFAYDDDGLKAAMSSKKRIYDHDGSLAAGIQNTIRCGDPWNEGIVWPKVAEISLLGALGCGKALLALVIERLESMQANGTHNYDYVALQATDNSIPFYESMGFVRVGCVTEKEVEEKNEKKDNEDKTEVVSSPVFTVTITKNHETPKDYAKKYDVDVWDIIFLTKFLYPDLTPGAILMIGTVLYIPDKSKHDNLRNEATKWYYSEDNETPREVAKKFQLDLKDLLAANRGRLENLLANSKLMENTKLQVSNLDEPDDKQLPYCHWTFPDDKFENNEPSYMMARKLNRKTRAQAKIRPVEESFAIKLSEYKPEDIPAVANASVVAPPPIDTEPVLDTTPKKKKKKSKKRKRHPDQPLTPKKPRTAYFCFLHHEVERLKQKSLPVSLPTLSQITSRRWKSIAEDAKAPFEQQATKARAQYKQDMTAYKKEMKDFRSKHEDWFQAQEFEESDSQPCSKGSGYKNLFNKVVKLNSEGLRQVGTEFEYYYVLTYIPDLFWCHLAPMRRAGIHTSKRAAGRTKWMLVDESEGKELDITGGVCVALKSRSMKGCEDADKEEWDIIDPEAESFKSSIVPKLGNPIVKTSSDSNPVSFHSIDEDKMLMADTVRVTAVNGNGCETAIDVTVPPRAVTERSVSDLSDRASDGNCSDDSSKVCGSVGTGTTPPKNMVDRDSVITPLPENANGTVQNDKGANRGNKQTTLKSFFN